MLRTQNWDMCCGLCIKYGINVENPEAFRQELQSLKKSKMAGSHAADMMALNDGQELILGPILREEGWDLILNGAYNKNHKSKIYVYARVLFKEQSNPYVVNPDY